MKKLLSLLCAILLIVFLTGACYADGFAPCGRADQQSEAGDLLRPADTRPGDGICSAYSYRTYNRTGTSPLSKAIAAGIVGAIAYGIKALFGLNKKPSENTQNDVQPDQAAAQDDTPENKFICRHCGKTSAGWYQNCPNCGAAGQMERRK